MLQDADHPGTLSARDLAGMTAGSGTKRSGTGKGSPSSSYLDSLSDLSRQTSADALALELGKEWMVDVSQVHGAYKLTAVSVLLNMFLAWTRLGRSRLRM